jgi:AAA15 family ATPase/GTPase
MFEKELWIGALCGCDTYSCNSVKIVMSIINDIEIKNFKSIRHQKIEGCKRINVFVGPPNVGKSNILEGLGLLTYIKNFPYPHGFHSLVRVEKLTQLFNNYNFNEDAIIHFNKKYSLLIRYIDEEQYNLKIFENEFGNIDKLLPNQWHMRGKSIYRNEGSGQSTTDGVDDFIGNFLEVQKLDIKPYKFLQEKKFNMSYSAKTFLIPEGRNMFEIIIANPQLQDEFVELLKPYNMDLVIDRSENDIKVSPKIKDRTIFPIPISLVADTLTRLMFFKTAVFANQNSVLLFEEPEAHMYPPYISKFTSDIMYDTNNNQFFITTHSPYVLNDIMENCKEDLAIYTVGYKKDTGETIIDKLSDDDMHEAAQFGYDFFLNLNNFIQAS